MGASALGAAASFFPSTRVRASGGPAKYLLLFHTPGTDTAAWSPVGSSDTSISFSEMTQPLEALRSELILFEGFDSLGTAAQHGAVGGLTGTSDWNSLWSLDQFVADRLAESGLRTAIPSVLLGSVPGEDQRSFWRPPGQALSPIFSPRAAFDVVFGGTTDPGESPEADAQQARRERSIALLQGEFDSLASRVGMTEQQKLGLHRSSLDGVLERIQGSAAMGPVAGCGTSAPVDTDSDVLNSALQLELAIAAFACDTTRVAAVQFGHHQNTQISLGEIGSPGNWHNDFMHSDQAPRSRLIAMERWLCAQFVAAAERLKSLPAPSGNGTLWDETLIVWTRDMGDGINHAGNDMRFVMSGGAGGCLQTAPGGRYINGSGAPHLRVLMTAAAAMGIDNFEGYGDSNLGGEDRSPLGVALS